MFARFEKVLTPTATTGAQAPPPGLIAFNWHFVQQAKALFIALFAIGFVVAMLDILIPVFIGRVVTLVSQSDPATLFAAHWMMLAGMAAVLVVVRPLVFTSQHLVMNQAIAANVSNRIRWQNHWHEARQSWAIFQSAFAGRIAALVMQTGPAIRETVVALITGVWY